MNKTTTTKNTFLKLKKTHFYQIQGILSEMAPIRTILKQLVKGKRRMPLNKVTKKAKKKPAKPSNGKMKVLKLNSDVQKEIFQYLSINDMVNTSLVWKNTKEALRYVFARKYSNEVITVTNFSTTPESALPPTPFLRRFGKIITNLKVQYNREYPRRRTEMEQAILKYSQQNLIEIEFEECDRQAFEHIQTPFTSVQNVTFTRCAPNKLIHEFNEWFPNARSLNIIDSFHESEEDIECIENVFPRLQHFGIINGNSFGTSTLTSFLKAIEINGQLTSIHFEDDNNLADDISFEMFLRLISIRLPKLERLNTNTSRFNFNFRDIVQFDNIKDLQLTIGPHMEYIPMHCGKLESLKLGGVYYHLDTETIENIGPNEKLVLEPAQFCPCGRHHEEFELWLQAVEAITRIWKNCFNRFEHFLP